MTINADMLNTFWILICAVLVITMQAGFCCVESGFVRSKNSINVAIKNFVYFFCIAAAVFWLFGYGIMFGTSYLGLFGMDNFWFGTPENPKTTAFFFFQMAFCGTAATLVGGAVAERLRFSFYIWMTIIICGIIYPFMGHWVWNGALTGETGGWLAQLGFRDFAGSTVVHSVGGWFALAAVMVLGPRIGCFGEKKCTISGHDLPMATLGVLILWIGWFGFNGGSTLEMNASVPNILLVTLLSGAFGGLSALAISWMRLGYARVEELMNGALTGLVGITASCNVISAEDAVIIGLISGAISFVFSELLQKMKIDDVFSVITVHGVGGVWGTLCVAIFGDLVQLGTGLTRTEQLGVQLTGAVVAFIWSFGTGYFLLRTANRIKPMRVSREAEITGLNFSEHRASTEAMGLLRQMNSHRTSGDFRSRASIDPYTEAGQIAIHYNQVLDRVVEEISEREQAEKELSLSKFNAEMLTEELKIALDESENLREDAESANQLKSKFLSNVGHELRTPMNAILGFSELLKGVTREHIQQEYIREIQDSGKGLLTLINDILDLSQMESGAMELKLKPVNLKSFMDQFDHFYRAQATEKGLFFEIILPENPMPVFWLDETRLRQIVMNLVGNAIKFTPSGSVRVALQIAEQPDKHFRLTFEISDTGIGIHREKLDAIFGAFVQENGDANREFEGTGLGLALAQKFAGLMNGSISVESEPGFGSTFRLVLPDVSVEESSAQPVALPDEIPDLDLVPDLQTAENPPHQSPESLAETRSEKEFSELNKLLEIMQSRMMEDWKEVSDTCITMDIQRFGAEVKSYGEQYSVPLLFNWGMQVEQFAESFRIDELNKKLEKYPVILKMFAESLKKDNNQG